MAIRHVTLRDGERVPAFGMGTWCLGDDPQAREAELAALRAGLDAGATLIDTAEMYGDGRSESLVGEAMAGRRDEVFLVSKVLPHHASRQGTAAACEASLRRLRTDRIDLYLLLARSHGMTAAQMSLAWLLAQDDVIVIPRTARVERMRENLAALDRLFEPPDGPRALEML